MKKIIYFLILLLSIKTYSQSTDDQVCLDCHSDNTLTKKKNGKIISLFVDGKKFALSVHEDISCIGCHTDVDPENLPHPENLAKVNCGNCHDDKVKTVSNDIHHRLKVKNPPTCVSCHSNHEVKKPPLNNTAKVIEYCNKCHTDKILANNYHGKVVEKNNCLACHKKVDVKLTLPSSVHKNLQCADCHNYISNNLANHPKNVKHTQKADCYLCHSQIAKVHRESIHGISLSEGIDEAAMCWDCHGSHNIQKVKSEFSLVSPKNLASTCGKCHDNKDFQKKFDIGIKNPAASYTQSVHGKLLKNGNKDVPTCTSCHDVHNIKNKVQEGSTISPFNIPKLCGQCHKKESEEYTQSIHWIRAKKGFRESPVCSDCHSEHNIDAVNAKNKRDEAKKLQEQTCIVCHQNPMIARRFGHTGENAKLYQDSYHGLAVMRGDKDAAMCIDCHGVHKILPKNFSESSVSKENVKTTCQKCHKDATQVFSESYSHITQNKEAVKIESIVSNIYFWLIFSVIGAMVLHNLLIYLYEVKKKRNKLINDITIPRFTKNEVVQHYLLFISFITLAITGFALKYPNSWWSELLRNIGMTETVRQYIHRGAAIIMIITGLYHIGYLLFTARGRDVLFNLIPKWSDVIEARDNILYYLRINKERPKFDEYDYTEKAEYWALIWGTIVMGVTGLFLWFPTLVGNWAPVWLIKVSELIHFYEAILATLAIVVWHWFFVIFHPHEYPMSLTWIDGKMSLHTYRHHHEKHFRKVVLEWKEYKSGKRELKKVSNSTFLFTSTLEKNGLNPDVIINHEIENDPELKNWLDEKLNIAIN
ncbi:cytochrome c3 family protein [Stygiobacter electus]|uniref:Cytochrome c3 family protein n=1 Tax=Stygiobacter electus TaxID=3032292 RepID=A0AAE3NZW5_9BACT|nr:cytochrome c3 family protein [Stygiobacter electus]MDF1611719.1 cytochrome c3 family protein [Stygiobacter electus]